MFVPVIIDNVYRPSVYIIYAVRKSPAHRGEPITRLLNDCYRYTCTYVCSVTLAESGSALALELAKDDH